MTRTAPPDGAGVQLDGRAAAGLEVFVAAVVEAHAARVLAAMPGIVRAEVRAALDEHGEGLRPLSEIDGITPDAARRRVERDPQLAALGLRVGRRLLFRAAEVRALRAGCQRGRLAPEADTATSPRLRAVDGGRP